MKSRPILDLSTYLARAASVGRRRSFWIFGFDLALMLGGLALLGTLATWVSDRGDLAAKFSVAAIFGGSILLFRRYRRSRSLWKGPVACARQLHRHCPALNNQSSSDLDLVAAAELLQLEKQRKKANSDSENNPASSANFIPGSPELAAIYVQQSYRRLKDLGLQDPADTVPALPWRLRASLLLGLIFAGLTLHSYDGGQKAWSDFLALRDRRPPPPPSLLWSELTLELEYPSHTGRSTRKVFNPSGALRLPAGTQVKFALKSLETRSALTLVFDHDPDENGITRGTQEQADHKVSNARRVVQLQTSSTDPSLFTGELEFKGSGRWQIWADQIPETQTTPTQASSENRFQQFFASLTGSGHASARADRSAPARIELEPDLPPEIEIKKRSKDEVSDDDRVELELQVRDDFGLHSVQLAYRIENKDSNSGSGQENNTSGDETKRIQIDKFDQSSEDDSAHPTHERIRYSWDLGTIAFEERNDVVYWIEVRDNDPGLGLKALNDPPGKKTVSPRFHLKVDDEEAKHAKNIERLLAIRDAAVELLAKRLVTPAAPPLPGSNTRTSDQQKASELSVNARLNLFDELAAGMDRLLTQMVQLVDELALDSKMRERHITMVAGVHKRLLNLQRKEIAILKSAHTKKRSGKAFAAELRKLGQHHPPLVEGLEDEIIRLDDLSDAQILQRIESLVARIEASQIKRIELLERWKAGDASVRSQLEELERRIREDMKRLSAARAQLRKEYGNDFINRDAFDAMQNRAKFQEVLKRIQEGDVDGALKRARESLDELQEARKGLQKQLAEEESPLSPEERARMRLLRELGRLRDEQSGLNQASQAADSQWRKHSEVVEKEFDLSKQSYKQLQKQMQAMDDKLGTINDARLSAEARESLLDAREYLQKLNKQLDQLNKKTIPADDQKGDSDTPPKLSALNLRDQSRAIENALSKAEAGSDPKSRNGKKLRQALKSIQELSKKANAQLPAPPEVLPEETSNKLFEQSKAQQNLDERSKNLLDSEDARFLPEPGRNALRKAQKVMRQAATWLESVQPESALRQQEQASESIEKAIQSLRQKQPPPPSPSSGGDASTESDRDRSLRDQVIEAMKERSGDSLDEATQQYYEELLK